MKNHIHTLVHTTLPMRLIHRIQSGSPGLRFGLIGVCIVGNWLLSTPLLRGPMIAEADAYVRYIQAYLPWRAGDIWRIDYASAWLPLHMIMLRIWFAFFSDGALSSRMMSFFFGCISIPMYYLYLSRHYSRITALLSTMLFTLLPLRIALGTQTLSESVFLPFLMALLLIGERKTFSPATLVLLAAIAAVATGIRYDAWMLLPYIWFSVFSSQRHPNMRAGIIILTILFPAWWLFETYQKTHIPGDFLMKKIEMATQTHYLEYMNPSLSFSTITTRLMELLPFPFLIFAGYGYYRLFAFPTRFESVLQENKTRFFYLMLPLYLLTLYWLQMIGNTMEWVPHRYLLIPVLLLLPIGIEGIGYAWRINRTVAILLLSLLVFIGPSYYWTGIWTTTRGAFSTSTNPQRMKDFWCLVRYLKSKPDISFQYLRTGGFEDNFPIAGSYFSRHYEIVDTLWESPESLHKEYPASLPGPLILEKPFPIWLSNYPVLFDSDSFAVIAEH